MECNTQFSAIINEGTLCALSSKCRLDRRNLQWTRVIHWSIRPKISRVNFFVVLKEKSTQSDEHGPIQMLPPYLWIKIWLYMNLEAEKECEKTLWYFSIWNTNKFHIVARTGSCSKFHGRFPPQPTSFHTPTLKTTTLWCQSTNIIDDIQFYLDNFHNLNINKFGRDRFLIKLHLHSAAKRWTSSLSNCWPHSEPHVDLILIRNSYSW
jgi:hypothetical protein